eukprot:m.73424 g.73424  ORF g.73424 m.73424 type:complete len:826 (+) comp24557_c0_seq1:164-2641(+)
MSKPNSKRRSFQSRHSNSSVDVPLMLTDPLHLATEGDDELLPMDSPTIQSTEEKEVDYQSLAYDNDESQVWRTSERHRHYIDRGKWWSISRKRSTKRWILVGLTGVITAWIGIAASFAYNALSDWKFGVANDLIRSGSYFLAFLAYTSTNLLFVSVSAMFVAFEPVAAGSGIPEVKCFLNGINLPRVMRIKTLLCKICGVVFSVAGGLPCGKEGPMIHSGACVGAGISQGKSSSMKFDVSHKRFQEFRNDREKRDFVACGAAAGVCTAFQAPIGGVLFALEEGASHWSTVLTWRTFFCTMMALWTAYVTNSVLISNGVLDAGQMFSFGKFYSLEQKEGSSNFDVWELFMFLIIGCFGGLIGGCFNLVNKRITVYRKTFFSSTGTERAKRRKLSRYAEVLVVSLLMSTLSFCLPLAWSRCRPTPTILPEWTEQEINLVDDLVRFQCENGTYNELASLFFVKQDVAIRHLFHFRETGDGDLSDEAFSPASLALFFMFYITMAVITYGLAVPSGLFVPSLLSGAAFGRLCANLFHRGDAFHGTFADSGTYALIGACAVLGGMARMTISLTVIMLEATGDMQYVLPLMITLLAARWTGNILCDSLYDIHIHLNKLPLLGADCPKVAKTHDMTASEIMSQEVVSLKPVMNVGELYDSVCNTTHSCFPVVSHENSLQGTIVRKRLGMLFQKKAFSENVVEGALDDTEFPIENLSPVIDWNELEMPYPRFPPLETVPPSAEEREKVIDIRPYINTSPYTIHESASVKKVYEFFVMLALRQLCVVDNKHICIGVVTRHDLLEEHIQLNRTQAWDRAPSAGRFTSMVSQSDSID